MDGLDVGLAYNLDQINRFSDSTTSELWICSAYVSLEGARGVEPLMAGARSINAVFGAGPITDPNALLHLQGRSADVRLFPHSPEAEFHPKCYFGRTAHGKAWAAVGSANLTGRGVDGNVELLTTVRGDVDHQFFADLHDWLAEVRSYSLKLTPELLEMVERMHEFQAGLSWDPPAEVAAALDSLGNVSAPQEFLKHMQREALSTYIEETYLFASYKLVILGILLKTPDGRLSLNECARRFHAFYVGLKAAGQQPERSTGSPVPPRMLQPDSHTVDEVEKLLLEAPREAFLKTGRVVVYQESAMGMQLYIARSLWGASTPESRDSAYERLLDRLESYYQKRVGTSKAVRAMMNQVCRNS